MADWGNHGSDKVQPPRLLAACKTLGRSPEFASPQSAHQRPPPTLYLTHALLRLCCATALRRVAIYAEQTRCCSTACQHHHCRRGHKQICKKLRRGGNAQQCQAYKKYKEAVAVAVEKRADDTKRSDVLHIMEVAG